MSSEPLWAALLAAVLLGETNYGAADVAGGALILGASLAPAFRGRRRVRRCGVFGAPPRRRIVIFRRARHQNGFCRCFFAWPELCFIALFRRLAAYSKMSTVAYSLSVALTFVTIGVVHKKFEARLHSQSPSITFARANHRAARARTRGISTRQIAHARGDSCVSAGRPLFSSPTRSTAACRRASKARYVRALGRPTGRRLGNRDCRAHVVQPRWRDNASPRCECCPR